MIETIAVLSVAATTMGTIINFDDQPARGTPASAELLVSQYASLGVSVGYANAAGWVIANIPGGTYPFVQARSGNHAAYFEGEYARIIFETGQQSISFWVAVEHNTRFQVRASPGSQVPATFIFDQSIAAGQWHQITIAQASGLIGLVSLNTVSPSGLAGQTRFALDDLSFTIPTTSSAGALAAGGLALLRRQRR